MSQAHRKPPSAPGKDPDKADEVDLLRQEVRALEQYSKAEIQTFGRSYNADPPQARRRRTIDAAAGAGEEEGSLDRTVAIRDPNRTKKGKKGKARRPLDAPAQPGSERAQAKVDGDPAGSPPERGV